MALSIRRYPINTPEIQGSFMVFNDSFVIRNISKDESVEIKRLNPVKRMRPIPPKRKDSPVTVTYIAQNLCEKIEFKEFYRANLGKSVKVNFEGRTYYGYLSNLLVGEFDVTFSFSYTSSIPDIPEDPGFPSR